VDKLVAEYRARPEPTEEQIDAWAVEDGDAWTDEDFARARVVYPPPTADEVRAMRARLGLTQAEFAHRFGFNIDTLQQYEQGRRIPSGPAATLLRVIAADPGAVERAIGRPWSAKPAEPRTDETAADHETA
jgi:putative transcriptional regulator